MNIQKANKHYKIIILPVLIIYVLLVFLDLLLTYLLTPDLAMEVNPIARVVRWKGMFILSLIYIFFSFFVYYKADKYMSNYFICKNTKQTISRIQSLSFYGLIILICAFYIHLLGSVFAVLNNILGIIYLKQYSFLNEIATQYVYFYNKISIVRDNYTFSLFFTIKNFLLWIIGICIAIYKIRRLKKYQTILQQNDV
jgi:hypothetical protein